MSTINKSGKRFVPKVRERKGNQGLANKLLDFKSGAVNIEKEVENEEKPVEEESKLHENKPHEKKIGEHEGKSIAIVKTVSKSSNVISRRSSTSITGHGIEFVQPSVAPRKRLNSLSTPSIPRQTQTQTQTQMQSQLQSQTQLTLPPSVSRRGSIAISASASRRGSIVEGRMEGLNIGGPVSIGIPVQRNKRRRVSRLEGVMNTSIVTTSTMSTGNNKVLTSTVSSTDLASTESTSGDMTNTDVTSNTTSKATELSLEFNITPLEMKLGKKVLFNKSGGQYEIVEIQGRTVEELCKNYEVRAVKSLRELSILKRSIIEEEDNKLIDNLILDIKAIPMRDLCKPSLPVGNVSENYELAIEGERKLKSGREYRRRVREMARQLRVSESEAVKLVERDEGVVVKKESGVSGDVEDDARTSTKININTNTSTSAPVLELSGGKLTYAAESTVVDRHGNDNDRGNMERIEENPFEAIVTSATYAPRPVTTRWTPQEVSELLRAVAVFGTDFTLISKLFPHRTRKQVKARFLLEEKFRPHLVEIALARRDIKLEVEEYAGLSGSGGIDGIPTVESFRAEIESLRERHAEEARALEESRNAALREDAAAGSGSGSGSGAKRKKTVERRAVVLAEFRKNEEVVGLIK